MRRRPWVAVLLSLLAPGLGHVYIGKPGKGAVMYAAFWLALAAV